ncbi:hypothetical protein [Mumia sp. DW29H23]|uniref:hypothetical protein n=1 Tax=Mumia sp. DW29H23 TaxID=3421241 RepID=UPI003D695B54
MTADAVTLLPWAALLSAIAGFFAWRAWKAGDRPAVVRRIGWALVPWALWLVGALKLVVRIGSAVADWAAGFVFRPSVWLGIAVAIVAVVLIVIGSRGRTKARAVGSKGSPAKPAVGGAKAAPAKRAKGGAEDDEFADIEDILRRHGIE